MIKTNKLRFFYCGILCSLLLVIIPNMKMFAQKVKVSGVIKSAIDSTRIPFCSVEVHNDLGMIVTGAQSDFDGRFSFVIDTSLLRSTTILFSNNCFQTLELTIEKLHLLYKADSTILLSPDCYTQEVKFCPVADISCDVVSIYYYFSRERPTRHTRREARNGKLILRKIEDGAKSCGPSSRFCKVHNIEF